ncbi:MAG: ABC transporter ATP-binding protein [Pseudomonadota bacterium]
MLRLENATVSYGKRMVLENLGLVLVPGQVAALIGANAAGKTTTLRCAAGLIPLAAGSVWLGQRNIARLSTPDRVRAGVVLVPEGRQIFPGMTVQENLVLGAFTRASGAVAADLERVFTLFPRVKERRKQRAGTMSGGEQQMVAIGRGLMAAPLVLLLDEPTLGLAPIIIEEIQHAVRELAAGGMSILIAEQNASFALRCSDTACILEGGSIRMNGESAQLARDPKVAATYLGI